MMLPVETQLYMAWTQWTAIVVTLLATEGSRAPMLFLRQIPVATLKLELAPRVVRLLLFLSQMVLALTVLMVVTPEG